jgi:hypothetical protein
MQDITDEQHKEGMTRYVWATATASKRTQHFAQPGTVNLIPSPKWIQRVRIRVESNFSFKQTNLSLIMPDAFH